MVRVTRDKVYLKIVFWGIQGAGKSTALDVLYNMAKESSKKHIDVRPTGELTRIPVDSEEGLFFDRGIFQSTKKDTVFFHVYTFTGEPSLDDRKSKSFFTETDGIVFVFDGQHSRWTENAESLSFLKKIAGQDLIGKIPMTVLITKKDMPDAVDGTQVEQLLRDEGLIEDLDETRKLWNPPIFEANLLDETSSSVYEAFAECARRAGLYQMYGHNTASTTRINLIIPEALKREWERFSAEVVHASMSQMIRDAVREYMNKMKQATPLQAKIPENPEDRALEEKIERRLTKKMQEIVADLPKKMREVMEDYLREARDRPTSTDT
jgi:GTPase SAR1 family protein